MQPGTQKTMSIFFTGEFILVHKVGVGKFVYTDINISHIYFQYSPVNLLLGKRLKVPQT